MNETIGDPFDVEFKFENDWMENLYQQQLQDRVPGAAMKTEDSPPAHLQLLLSPASSTTTSSFGQAWNSQQHRRPTPALQCVTTHTYAVGSYLNNPLTPPDDYEHDIFKLDTMLLGLLPPAEPIPLSSSANTTKRQRPTSSTKDVPRTSKRRNQHPAPAQPTAVSLSTDPLSPQAIKRVAFLNRNRMAAFKCRAKKREWTVELEERAHELKRSKEQHNIAIASLRSELLYLETEVFRHLGCGDAMRQTGPDIPAHRDSRLDGISNEAAEPDGRTGDESSHLSTTANDFSTREMTTRADSDTEGDFVDEDHEYSYSSMYSVSNGELETLLIQQIAKDEGGK
ncbi:hypothetical protein MMC34_000361 [Xylographa carneopallida]|nr:hypothetical protein [Xylographa carneopallida]